MNLIADFDDMSCEMIFGQDPPAASDDPAFKQPCYKLCNHLNFIFSAFSYFDITILNTNERDITIVILFFDHKHVILTVHYLV